MILQSTDKRKVNVIDVTIKQLHASSEKKKIHEKLQIRKYNNKKTNDNSIVSRSTKESL